MSARLPTSVTSPRRLVPPWAWRWPAPALAAWACAWLAWACARRLGAPSDVAALAGVLAGTVLAWPCEGAWRRLMAAAGFPLSLALLSWRDTASGWPAWTWALLALPLLAAYPVRAWRDAPFFPTPADALQRLAAAMPAPGRVLDAGCGLGHGLHALHRLWPQAQLDGVEWSPLLARAAAWRCPWARVQRGDMWAAPWGAYDCVYLFQRPESMPRAWAKATAEMAAGSFVVSLEFPVPGLRPWAAVDADGRPGRRPVWVYRVGEAALSPRAPRSTTSRPRR
jgi:SAM-dependent methyltransferase